MSNRTKLLDIELTQPIETIANLEDYDALQGLVRLQGAPIGLIYLPVRDGCCLAHSISQAITDQHLQAIAQQLVYERLSNPNADWQVANLLRQPQFPPPSSLSVTVALCVQSDDAESIVDCLTALDSLSLAPHEVLVVESAQQSDTLMQLASRYPQFRYLSTPAGFNVARNLAIAHAQGDIVAFTSSRSIVDAGWTNAIAHALDRNADAIALTGFIVPDHLETSAQHRFEVGYGFGRGYDRRRYCLSQAPNSVQLGAW
ncbi:MAG: glycosyltransferase family 2 protein, partial [Microcoleus sp. SIO2G3]|nr:glycosyltransferase family 2 protein [Microcoleus sp. SIO2G3]